jgi:transcriptional regulator with XRE-family HTH domain
LGIYSITGSNGLSKRTLSRTRKELSDFLIRHRNRLTPADVGLPSTGRRRTPGLRREEVAALAGVGVTWYTWFEQGRDIRVSEDFLLRIAGALRLDDVACSHLFLLAHRRPPPPEAYQWPSVSPLVQQLLDDLVARPAYVVNLRWDVVAWNAAVDLLFGFSVRDRGERNFLRLIFTDADLRRRLTDWREDAPKLLAQFRRDLATAPEDPILLALVDELNPLSADFRAWWAEPPVEDVARAISAILDPDGVRRDFRHEVLVVDVHRHLRMIVLFEGADAEGGAEPE